MCGFSALYSYSMIAPPIEQDELESMNNAMIRRGPDGEGVWLSDDKRVGLAHRRLAIIDLSTDASQPMTLQRPEGCLKISYNGEIYNFKELRRDLESAGHKFKTNSDTEVLLHLYDRYGRAMVERLRGMFAFALWDEAKKGMLLARDGFGIKPLYYSDESGVFCAASQVKALLARLEVKGQPRPGFSSAGHAGFFIFGYVPEPHTLYKSIKALKAGTTLWVDSEGPRNEQCFFNVSDYLSNVTHKDASENLGDLLRDSVYHHFVSDVPVGVFLSSGLDSTTLVGLSSELQGAGLNTISLGFDEFRGSLNDEIPLAEKIAATYGTHQHSIRILSEDFYEHMDDLLSVMDQPSIDGVNTYFVSKAAASQGLKVAISGLGGDEIFTGYNSFSQVPRLVASVGRIPCIDIIGRFFRGISSPLIASGMPQKAAGLLEYSGCYGDAYLLRRSLYMPWEIGSILGEDMAREGLSKLAVRKRLNDSQNLIQEPRAKISALEMSWYMRNQLLRDADWAGMAHGVEIRVPFVDLILFKALAGAIAKGKGPNKQDMVKTPNKIVPKSILNRAKSGFCVPISEWINAGHGEERGLRGWAKVVYQSQIS